MKDFATALALAIAIEGLLYAVLPAAMQRMSAHVAAISPTSLRLTGLAAACLGVAAVWLIRG